MKEAKRIRKSGTCRSRVQERRGRNKGSARRCPSIEILMVNHFWISNFHYLPTRKVRLLHNAFRGRVYQPTFVKFSYSITLAIFQLISGKVKTVSFSTRPVQGLGWHKPFSSTQQNLKISEVLQCDMINSDGDTEDKPGTAKLM